jgi:hypothetical protein
MSLPGRSTIQDSLRADAISVLSWAEGASLEDMPNFEGLGFDMLGFECPDGVWGQVALGHTGNLMALHGGPHDVLVDKRGLLTDVTFPLL